MAGKCIIAIGFSERRLRAIEVTSRGDELGVRQVLRTRIPDSIELDDADAVGRWMGDQLKQQGFPRGRAIFAMAREHVSLKRLTLPTTDEFELPGMVRLSMQRDLPFDPDDAVIDYVPVEETDGQTIVLVAAIQQQLVTQVKQIAKAAGITVERISLRCMGLSALMRSQGDVVDEHNAILGVDVTGDSVEICVITNGQIRFSRAAKIARSEDSGSFADAVVTETRRSWMSYRIVEDAPSISSVQVFGDPTVTKPASQAIGELTGVTAVAVAQHPRIDTDRHKMVSSWPLAGLLLEPLVGGVQSLDFANPRQAPIRHARARRAGLLAAGLALLVGAAITAAAVVDIHRLKTRRADLLNNSDTQLEEHFQYERDFFRDLHLERWHEARVDWLAHLHSVYKRLPSPDQLLLDQFHGSLRYSGVDYDSRARDRAQRWTASKQIVITLDGEAVTQSMVDDFRRTLATSPEYRVSPSGPDAEGGKRYPFPFKLTLRTDQASPATGLEVAGSSPDGGGSSDEVETGEDDARLVDRVVEGERRP